MKLNRRLFGLLASGRFEFERKVSGLNRFLSITLFCFFLGFILGKFIWHFFVWSQTDFSLGWVYYFFLYLVSSKLQTMLAMTQREKELFLFRRNEICMENV